MKFSFVILLQALFLTSLSAQHDTETISETQQEAESKNFFGLFLGNTVLYQTNIHLPTVGVEYVREIGPRLGLGAILEVEIGYEVIDDKTSTTPSTLYTRETAILFQPAIFYRLYRGFIVSAGYGVEFENTEDEELLGLFKVGVEYRLRMQNPHWFVLPSLSWDHTSRYDGVVYGLVFAYKF
jgi:hypothetical protein